MLFYFLTSIFMILLGCAWWRRWSGVNVTVLLFYAMTSALMGLVISSRWTFIYLVRYFLYVISGLIIVGIPFVLGVLGLITLSRLRQEAIARWRQLLHLVIGLTLVGVFLFSIWGVMHLAQVRLQAFISMYIMLALYFTATFVSYLVLNFSIKLTSLLRPAARCVVILGLKMTSPQLLPVVLARRLDRALDYYCRAEQPERIRFIVTGGPIHGTQTSEAIVMRDYLVSHGIPTRQILVEDHARNTEQNLIYSQQLMTGLSELGSRVPLIVSSNFHLLRVAYYAWRYQVAASFVGARVPMYLWPYSMVREYLAFLTLAKEWNYAYIILLIIMGLSHVFG